MSTNVETASPPLTTPSVAPPTPPVATDGGRILVVDDDVAMCEVVRAGLGRRGFQVETCGNVARALAKLEASPFEAVLCDLHLGDESGLELCKIVSQRWPDVPVIVITGFGSLSSAVDAIRVGAYDFVTKPIELDPLEVSLRRGVGHHRLRTEVARLRSAHAPSDGADRYDAMVGKSQPMRKLFDLLARLEDSGAPVLIAGESGTGKELVARALHRQGPRGDGPFVALNCAAVPGTLLESTLFGHVRGAFTDARESRDGLIVEAQGGTLFLDEIGEMPMEMQVKLLRVLQERQVRPVGGAKEVPFDARIITASNRDLQDEVDQGNFREDLYYRVNVVGVHVPPLRSRGNDVLLLAQTFLERHAERNAKEGLELAPATAERLLAYPWPGNVRELDNVIERAVALTRGRRILPEDLPPRILEHRPARFSLNEAQDLESMPTLDQVERQHIERVLDLAAGNKTLAARVLGVDRRTLYRKLKRWKKEAREAAKHAN